MTTIKRRTLLGGIGLGGIGAASAVATGVPGLGPGPAVAAAEPARARPAAGDFLVGVAGAHYITHGRGYDPESLDMLVQSGATATRVGINWGSVEREKGVYFFDSTRGDKVREAVAAGLDVMVVLGGNNPLYGGRPTTEEGIAAYTEYALTVIRGLRGVVTRFEIWNEWEGGDGKPEDYLRVLRAASAAIREQTPQVEILAGSMLRQREGNSDWIDTLLEAGVLGLCDALSLHTYNIGESPELRTPEAWLETRMQFMAERVRPYNDGQDFPMYVTEMGWSNDTGPVGTSYEEAAVFLARVYLLAATLPYCKGLYWYNLQDSGWEHENFRHNWGLIRPDGTPKPAYFALQSVAELLTSNSRYVERMPTPDPDIWALRFVRGQERTGTTIALWSAHLENHWSVVLKDGAGRGRDAMEVEEVGRRTVRKKWGREEWYDSGQVDPDEPVYPDEAEVTVRDAPLLIRGQFLDDVTITRVLQREFPEDRPPRPE